MIDVKVFIQNTSWYHFSNCPLFFLDNFCTKYCQNGICMNNQTGYSCTCPPGTSLDYLLDCVGK